MTEEEKKAIERCKQIIKDNNEVIKEARKNRDINCMQLTASLDNDSIAIDTVLNLIQKQQSEYSDLKLKYEQNLRMCKHFRTELNKQDKIIDEMAIAIGYEPLPTEEYCIFRDFNCPVVGGNRDCKECVKQYFEKKVEGKQYEC